MKKSDNSFLQDVVEGFSAENKHLSSKYFYDEKGSLIFREIMNMEEYYLPYCEIEILKNQSGKIAEQIPFLEFDVIELGAGDGSKTVEFLERIIEVGKKPIYFPLDISIDILEINKNNFKKRLPDLEVISLPGDYFHTIEKLKDRTPPRLVMLMGSNIGNFNGETSTEFIRMINDFLNPGDFFLMGVDLKKNPHTICAAYNDKEGITKRFNLNLLERINRELSGNIDLQTFDHFGTYNPLDGTAMSFLVSLVEQDVTIPGHTFYFDINEVIHTEVSQKYSLKDLDNLAVKTGFIWDMHFTDKKGYFSVSLFRK